LLVALVLFIIVGVFYTLNVALNNRSRIVVIEKVLQISPGASLPPQIIYVPATPKPPLRSSPRPSAGPTRTPAPSAAIPIAPTPTTRPTPTPIICIIICPPVTP
jgi:hypothetical protein